MVYSIFSKSVYIGDKGKFNYLYNFENPNGIFLVDCATSMAIQNYKKFDSIEKLANIYQLNVEALKKDISILQHYGFIDKVNSTITVRQKTGRVFDAWIHITNKCNLDCIYCYIDKSPEDMSLELAHRIIKQIVNECRKNKSNRINLRFAGGEPLCKIDLIKEIVEFCSQEYRDIIFSYNIITNGTLLNEEIVSYLSEKRFKVGVSIDGSEHFHNITRLNHTGFNSYKKTMENIECALDKGLSILVLTTISNYNLDGLEELTRILIEKKMRFRFSLERSIIDIPKLAENQDKLVKTLNRCMDIMEDFIVSGNTSFDFQFNDINFKKLHKRSCGAGATSFAAGHDGKIGLCGMGLTHPIGTIEDGNPYDIVKDKSYGLEHHSVDSIKGCEMCVWKYCCASGCPIQNFYLNGSYESVSLYCMTFKEIIPRYLEIKALLQYYRKINGL